MVGLEPARGSGEHGAPNRTATTMARVAKVCLGAWVIAFAVNMVCMMLAWAVSGPEALISVFRYGTWILFPVALPISAKYLK